MTPDLSILIPARNERWLTRTVRDVLEHAQGQTDVIVVLDGAWPEEPLPLHPRLHVIYHPAPVGQRAAVNEAARVSTARYVMKLDAHCALEDGFDVKLVGAAQTLGRNVLQVPAQKNLHVYDVVCTACGWRQRQGVPPETCPTCALATGLKTDVVWKPKRGSTTTQWFFDETLHFQYYDGERRAMRPTQEGPHPETMSLLGACWFAERSWFLEDLDGLDEAHGSWGQMGTELACKAWLSGGRVVCNRETWFAHFFRVGGIGFPYELKASAQEHAREYSRDLWKHNRWPKQTRPLSWLVEHFAPVPGWTTKTLPDRDGDGAVPSRSHDSRTAKCDTVAMSPSDPSRLLQAAAGRTGMSRTPGVTTGALGVDPAGMLAETPTHRETAFHPASAGVLYYSDSRGDDRILSASRRQLRRAAAGLPIVAVTLPRYPVDNVIGAQGLVRIDGGPCDTFAGMEHVVLPLERGYLTMARQILAGLRLLDTNVVFFCEHDCLYPAGYFDYRPPAGVYAYAAHTWKVDAVTGRALTYQMEQLSGLCADRALLLDHFRRRVAHLEAHGFSRRLGFEPGKPIRHGGLDDVPRITWPNPTPIVDIRHGDNLTPSRWSKDQFRNQKYTEGWTEADAVPGWGHTAGRFSQWLDEVTRHG